MLGYAFALYLSVKGRRVAHKLRCVFVDACALIEEEGEPREVILVARSQPCTYVRTYACVLMCTVTLLLRLGGTSSSFPPLVVCLVWLQVLHVRGCLYWCMYSSERVIVSFVDVILSSVDKFFVGLSTKTPSQLSVPTNSHLCNCVYKHCTCSWSRFS